MIGSSPLQVHSTSTAPLYSAINFGFTWVHFTLRLPPVFPAVLADERTQIWSDPIPGLSVHTLGAFRVEIAVTRSESILDRWG